VLPAETEDEELLEDELLDEELLELELLEEELLELELLDEELVELELLEEELLVTPHSAPVNTGTCAAAPPLVPWKPNSAD
jgi:hypothetical protein